MTAEKFKQLQLDKNFEPLTLKEMEELEPLLFKETFKDEIHTIKRRGTVTEETRFGLVAFTKSQLDAKFKHAVEFGINTTKKNAETMLSYQRAIVEHLEDYQTKAYGQYRDDKQSVVYYNPNTMIAVAFKGDGEFTSVFKLEKGTTQYGNYIKNGVLF